MRGAGRGAGEARGEARVRGARMGAGRGAVRSWAHTAVDESMQVFILRIVFFHSWYWGAFLCARVQVSGVARGMLRGLNAGATSTGQLRPRASWDIGAAKQNQCLLSGMASCHHFTVRFSAVQPGAAWRDIRTRVRKKGRWRVIAVNRRASL